MGTILVWAWKYLGIAAVGLCAVFAPISGMLTAAFVLICADMVFGCWASLKRGERLRSDRLRATVVKIVVYLAAICLAFLAGVYLMSGALPLAAIVAGLIGTVELKSIFENLDEIAGGSVFKAAIAKFAPRNVAKNGETSH